MPTNNFKVGEMLNKRTPNSKTWMNFDGSFTTEIHSGIVHYQDENGNFQNINTDLYDEADFDSIDFPVARDGDSLFFEAKEKAENEKKKNRLNRDNFDFQGLKVPFEAKLPRNIKRGYNIGKGASKLTFIPEGASPSKGYVEGNKITYQDAWNDTDLILEVLPDGIKETIILKSERAPFNFTFEVQGNLEGEMKIQPPWLQDAEGTKRDVVQGVSELDGKILLNLAADVSGLVYPIEIDPTVTLDYTKDLKDTYIFRGDPDKNFNYTNDLLIGMNGGVSYIRTLIKFDLSSIPLGSTVSGANLNLYHFSGNGDGSTGCVIHPINEDWSETSVTWNNQPSFDTTISTTTSIFTQQMNSYVPFDVKPMVEKWLDGTKANHGLLLKSYEVDVVLNFKYYSRETSSANKPKLVITYNQPPIAPTVTAPNGGETWNSLEAVTWNAASDPEDLSIFSPVTGSADINYTNSRAGQTFTVDREKYIKSIALTAYSSISESRTMKLTGVGADGLPNSTVYATGTVLVDATMSNRELILPNPLLFPVGTKLAIVLEPNTGNTSMRVATSDVYSGGSAFFGTTLDSNRDVVFQVKYYNSSLQSQLQYQIQLTTNNGGSWKDIVSLTNAGATSYPYDFINEPETSLAKIRVRAFDGSAYGPWDESDGVFTIQHNQAPTAPTNLSPTSGTRDRAAVNRLSWQHNDANADPQAKFDLQWRIQGSTTWNDVTQTTVNQFYDAPANLFPRGTIEWRVRTYDQADLSSPYSAIATFFAGDKPAVPTIVSPGALVAVANPTVQWSSTDQTGFLLVVKDSTGTTVFSKERTSTNKAETITYSLGNQQNYTIELKIKNADGLYSDAAVLNISVSYTPPAIPEIETVKGNSFIQINISDPVPTGTQPAVLYHEIYKEINNDFVLFATNVQNEFKDYQVANGEVTSYFVRTQGNNETFSDTNTFSESISFIGVWMHIVEDPENTVHQFMFDGGGRSSKWGLESAVHHFQGRKRPVIETGEMEEFTVDFTLKLLDDAERLALEKIVYSQETVCYRDGRGRKAFGVFVEVPLNDEVWRGYSTNLSLMKIDFKEGIE
ncbi:DNRLRE domain-containing protein [Cytobacillus pseudoceanisediminis]|uniref:DNRLRE domain-containing protein n=1 Tax=Cytobacillus pseudoceanisediminis TaxID=3051614 RepID=A0ABZ2ZIZ8_9BACI